MKFGPEPKWRLLAHPSNGRHQDCIFMAYVWLTRGMDVRVAPVERTFRPCYYVPRTAAFGCAEPLLANEEGTGRQIPTRCSYIREAVCGICKTDRRNPRSGTYNTDGDSSTDGEDRKRCMVIEYVSEACERRSVNMHNQRCCCGDIHTTDGYHWPGGFR
ncbi:hypothetical protein GY45DRAFT_764244 [Cubamyces sp. BRFM 1775]|nr:hypothetical protein GY45DRAFT_764244 [Cubamyces sp. BRFM 1775]